MNFKNFLLIFTLSMVLLCCFSAVNASENMDDSISTVSDDIAIDEVVSEVDSGEESIAVDNVEQVDDVDDSNSALAAKENEDNVSGQVSEDFLQSDEPIDFYVSPEGSDANNGSIDAPFGTIQYAIDSGFEKSSNVIVHLLKGTYSGDGNVGLTIANEGTLQLLGEEYGETIIDGNEENYFFEILSETIIKNLKFSNGLGICLYGNDKVTLTDCIMDNNNGEGSAILVNANIDNLTFTNNNGGVYLSECSYKVSNSYFAYNRYEDGSGILWVDPMDDSLTIENCNFINNVVDGNGGAIYIEEANGIYIKNCYFEGNSAQNGGAIFVPTYMATVTFENNTFYNNKANKNGVIGFDTDCEDYMSPALIFNECKFINNSAVEAGVATLKVAIFNDCSFTNNSADYGGALVILPYNIEPEDYIWILPDYDDMIASLELNNVVFENNIAEINGNDIYLGEAGYTFWSNNYQYIPLTITFNDLNVNSFSDNLTATVTCSYEAVVGSAYGINFELNGNKIGSANIVNGVSILNYDGFKDGEYVLSGSFYLPHSEDVINEADVIVKLEGVVDHIEFWISPEGSDENGNGSESNPFKSISHAVNEASKVSRDIVIHIGEGIYSGDLNTGLKLSSVSNLTLIGAGTDKTLIDGENTTYFATISKGENKIVISDLTIKNMLPDNRKSKIIDSNIPLTIDEGATLVLNNVELSDNHGGQSIISNNGDLIINNSVITRNGLSNGIITGGNLYIYNSAIFDNYIVDVRGFSEGIIYCNSIVVNNSNAKGNYILVNPSQLGSSAFVLIKAEELVIENTNVSSGGNNESLMNLGFEDSDTFNPAISISSVSSGKLNMTNTIMDYDFEGTIYSKDATNDVICPCALACYGMQTGADVLNIFNSSFTNFKYIWMSNGYREFKYTFDGCLFNNITYIALSRTVIDTQYNITNSIFLFEDDVIMSQISAAEKEVPNVMANNNYWGNSKAIMYFLGNTGIKDQTYNPKTWIILTEEDGQPVFKITDGENLTDYEGTLPATISYIVDENGNAIPVLNIAGTGYKFSFDENGTAVLNTVDPIKNIVPLVPVNETVFAENMAVIINDGSKFTANFTDKWGIPLKETKVSFIIGDNTINATTDANGTASFTIDFALGEYLINTVNPVTGQSIFNTVAVTTHETTFASDVNATYKDNSKFSAKFTDKFGNPLANTNVTFIVNNKNITAVTDVNGTVFFTIDFNAGTYNVSSINPVTSQSVDNKIIVSALATKLTASKLTMVYNTGKSLTATLKDANGNALAKQDVFININGKTYKRTTDTNGQVSFKITLPVKTYTATITFKGDNNYVKSTASAKVVVNKASPKMIAKKKTFKTKTKKYTITLKDNKGKAMKKVKVTLTTKVKGKKVKLTVKTNNKGKATFNLKKLTKKGKYTATVKFAGNKNFKAVTKKAKITVKK